jgi:hypothetical protein
LGKAFVAFRFCAQPAEHSQLEELDARFHKIHYRSHHGGYTKRKGEPFSRRRDVGEPHGKSLSLKIATVLYNRPAAKGVSDPEYRIFLLSNDGLGGPSDDLSTSSAAEK